MHHSTRSTTPATTERMRTGHRWRLLTGLAVYSSFCAAVDVLAGNPLQLVGLGYSSVVVSLPPRRGGSPGGGEAIPPGSA